MSTEQQAALLEEIAAVMRERPEDGYKEFEYTFPDHPYPRTYSPCGPDWDDLMRQVADPEYHVRRRPRTITIAGVEVPEPMREAPPEGATYCVPDFEEQHYTRMHQWCNDSVDRSFLANNLCHRTHEAAQQHARALIIASGGEVE